MNTFEEAEQLVKEYGILLKHTYVVYTTEGYTETPKGREVENCQILAILDTDSIDRDEIIAMLTPLGEHMKDYSKDKIIIRECFDNVL